MSDKEKAKGFLHAPNPWVVTIVGILLTPIVTGIIDFFQDRDVFHTFLSIVTWIWVTIVWFMLIDVKVIHVVGVVVVWVVISLLRDWWQKDYITPSFVPAKMAYFSYTEGRFNGNLKWSWKYGYHSTPDFPEIKDLVPHCPTKGCDTHLIVNNFRGIAECPRCHETQSSYSPEYSDFEPYNYLENMANVEAVIRDNIRKRNFPGSNKGNEE